LEGRFYDQANTAVAARIYDNMPSNVRDSDNYSQHSGSLLATECKNNKQPKHEKSINIPGTDIKFIIMMHRHMHNGA
jgi:hypothetical protein